MMLARFEQPDGGFSVLADNLQLSATLSQCGTLLLAALPAGLAGASCTDKLVRSGMLHSDVACIQHAWTRVRDHNCGCNIQARLCKQIAPTGWVGVTLCCS